MEFHLLPLRAGAVLIGALLWVSVAKAAPADEQIAKSCGSASTRSSKVSASSSAYWSLAGDA